MINEDETLDDLLIGGLYIIQKRNAFRFGTDAVLLSDFASRIKSRKTLDLCTGNGIIPLLLSAKSDTPEIFGIEIQPPIADMAKRSVKYNSLEDRVTITEGDLRKPRYGRGEFDLVTCNPPYIKNGGGIKSENSSKLIARHEVECTLRDAVSAAAAALKPLGHFVMVHRAERLADILCTLREFKLEPKILRLVYPDAQKPPNLVLVDAQKDSGENLKLLPPLFLFNSDGERSEELKRIYSED